MGIKVKELKNVSWIIIDRREKANSLDYEHLVGLAKALNDVCNASQSSTVVALKGEGDRYFSAGIDLVEVRNSSYDTSKSYKLILYGVGKVLESILRCKKPVVSALNGSAFGLAVELVEVSDLAYAVKNARISVPALRWGLIPPVAPFLTFDKRVTEMLLTGRTLSAEEALRYAILNDVVKDLNELENKVIEVSKKVSETDLKQVSVLKEVRYALLWPSISRGLELMSLSVIRDETRRRIEEGFIKRM